MPGFWATDYWPNSATGLYWATDYWPEYGTGIPVVTDARAVHGQAVRWIMIAAMVSR